jgi:hypothetical protein
MQRNQIAAIRELLDRADYSTTVTPTQIGQILIALNTLTDLVETLLPPPLAVDPLASARHEYQAERRIDEWSAYHAQESDQ